MKLFTFERKDFVFHFCKSVSIERKAEPELTNSAFARFSFQKLPTSILETIKPQRRPPAQAHIPRAGQRYRKMGIVPVIGEELHRARHYLGEGTGLEVLCRQYWLKTYSCKLPEDGQSLMRAAMSQLNRSARAYYRILK